MPIPSSHSSASALSGWDDAVTDHVVKANGGYAAAFTDPGLSVRPARKVAVVTCMDARLDLPAALGLELGAATPSATPAAWSPMTSSVR